MKQKEIIHYGCPCCFYSTWNQNEENEGEALQNVKDHLRKFHDRNDLDEKIKQSVD